MERKHPNELLNEMVAYYVLRYMKNIGFAKTGSVINQASWDFLKRSDIDPNTDRRTLGGFQLGTWAAQLQGDLLKKGGNNTSLRSIIRQNQHLLPLVAHGPQALLIESYLQMLQKLHLLDLGHSKYGIGKDVYRDITTNVMAARLMFETASQKIADLVYQTYSHIPNLGLVEGGAGNGAAMLAILDRFPEYFWPDFLLSDIDEKTRATAVELFKSKGYDSELPWIKVDLGSLSDILKIERLMRGQQVLFSVNFIIHEHESIIENFFSAMGKGLPGADLSITEFFLPEDEISVGSNFPWWFVYLHEVSGQRLRTEEDFLAIAEDNDYHIFDRIDHQMVSKKPLISTLFLKK